MVGRNINDDVSLAYLFRRNKKEAVEAAEKAAEEAEISPANMNAILNKVYPVGAIYTSTSSTSPASIFGGTWEQLQNRFLLAAGTSYTAGATGGEASHTLSVNEIPSHNHSVGAHSHGLNSHVHSVGAHAHGLNNHVHSVGAHAHGLNSHTHSIPALSGSATGGSHTHPIPMYGLNNSLTQSSGQHTTYWSEHRATTKVNTESSTHTHSVTTSASTTGQASGSTANSTAFNTGGNTGNTANSSAFNSGAASGSTANSSAFDSGSKGGGTAHNNMPPYLVVYMWKRTA